MVTIEVDVPAEIVKFLEAIGIGARKYIERGLPEWVAGDLDACCDIDVWFRGADVPAIAKYLVEAGDTNPIMREKAGVPAGAEKE